jgi:hypothetical protein
MMSAFGEREMSVGDCGQCLYVQCNYDVYVVHLICTNLILL